ncbi:peptidyl-prolyl cis-trans isomerase [Prosthecobacter sp.]|uniref:peptidyl-prolyl cis-trans isomerase n=1 Tax=Prosthecobacter sp. TaxID=1965333 RepID=UPI002ABCEBE8|nr:peptidyl-prolyl cis-trans isomerase [Prosthecobacter sp.]MDZ4404012.1 peptidyl-prolyl cis-trans isomerase [Prosthecobacter sp.]
MLEFFRRHRGAFLITLTIIIIVSFSVWGGWRTDSGYEKKAQITDHALTVYGKDYTIGDVQRAQRSLQFAQYYMQAYELPSMLMMLSSDGGFGGGGLNTLINLFVARHLMEDLGIRPSDAEARAALEKLPALQNNGKFDVSRAQMLEENAGSMGFESGDLLGIMKDTLGLQKLQDIVTKSYVASPLAAEKQYASSYHTFKGSKITFETEAFKKAAAVTDDEIKKYYEENKDGYKTLEKRAVSYVLFENPKDLDKKPLEERQKAQNQQVERVNAFNKLTASGVKFAEAAKQTKEKIETVPAFPQGEPPAALKTENNLLGLIFARAKDSKTQPEAIEGSNGWYVFDVTQIEEPKQQTLAEVKDKIKDTLQGQKADEARTKAVNDARTALNDGLKAGKKIDDLVKEKKLTLEALPDIDIANPPQEVPNAFLIAQEASKTAVANVSRAVDYDKGTLLIYVSAKELRKRPDGADVRKNQVDSLSRQERMSLFQSWFKKKHDEARVVTKLDVS